MGLRQVRPGRSRRGEEPCLGAAGAAVDRGRCLPALQAATAEPGQGTRCRRRGGDGERAQQPPIALTAARGLG